MNRTKYETTVTDDSPATTHVEYGRVNAGIVSFVVLLYYYVTGVPGRDNPRNIVGSTTTNVDGERHTMYLPKDCTRTCIATARNTL